jgi:anti-sigma factor RsiW
LIPWDTLIKGGLAAAGIVVAIGLIFAGFGWPLAAPDFARNAPASADNEYVGSLPKDWREEVARAQALLSRASLEVGLDSQGNRDFVAMQLGRAIGAELAPPDLSAHKFRFTRAQVLRFGGEKLAQLLYLGTRGAPLALYVKTGGIDAAPRLKRYGEVAGVAWSQGGMAYFLAGEEDEVSLLRLVEAVRRGEDPPRSASDDLPPPPSRSPARR